MAVVCITQFPKALFRSGDATGVRVYAEYNVVDTDPVAGRSEQGSVTVEVSSASNANAVEVLIRDAVIAEVLAAHGMTLPGSNHFMPALRRN